VTDSDNGNSLSTAVGRDLVTWPNLVSLGRAALVPLFLVMVLRHRSDNWRFIQAALFTLIALSDALDGFLARRLKARSALGTIIDPLADKVVVVPTYLVLSSRAVLQHHIPLWLAFPVVTRDVLMALGSLVIYLRHGTLHVKVTPLGKAATVFQMATVVAFILSQVAFPWGALTALKVGTFALTVASGAQYVVVGLKQLGRAPAAAPGETQV